MENYIRVYDDVVSDVFCDKMIIQFEKTAKSNFTVEHINREGRPTFHQINLHNLKEWQPFSKTLQIVFKKYIHIYEEECNITEYHWPIQHGYEQYRIKKYLPNVSQHFAAHFLFARAGTAHYALRRGDNRHAQTAKYPRHFAGAHVFAQTGLADFFDALNHALATDVFEGHLEALDDARAGDLIAGDVAFLFEDLGHVFLELGIRHGAIRVGRHIGVPNTGEHVCDGIHCII